MTIKASNHPVKSGLGSIGSVCDAWMTNSSGLCHDEMGIHSLKTAIADVLKSGDGPAALRAIACAILNRDIRNTQTIYWISGSGDAVSVSDLSDRSVDEYCNLVLSR